MFIVITKYAKDLEKKDKVQKHLPELHPIECVEYASREEAIANHPGCVVLSAKDYAENVAPISRQAFEAALGAANKKPFWKFWA